MTEDDARRWVRDRFDVSRETSCAKFAELVGAEALRQNLISSDTLPTIWARHIVDSAQLLCLRVDLLGRRRWVDIGSGAGFPGVVVALLSEMNVTLVEPRRRRAEFLQSAIDRLGISTHVTLAARKIESVAGLADILSARAVAPLSALFAMAIHLAHSSTVWLLPKGEHAEEELEIARQDWHGVFHVEQSVTNPLSKIVVAHGVRRR